MKSNECSECSECNQPLIKSVEGIPLYYYSTSFQSPKNKNIINNKNIDKNIKYDEQCAKYNLIVFGLFMLIVIICLIIFFTKN